MKLFEEITYTNNQKTLKATDSFLLRAWGILCGGETKKLSAEAIRCLLSVNDTPTSIKTSSLVANELSDPFYFASDGAILYPEEFQPWERYDLSLCERVGSDFVLTYEGEVMKSKMLKEISTRHEQEVKKINSNIHIHELEV